MNHEQIEGFAALFGAVPKLTEIEVRSEGATLRLRRHGAPLSAPALPAPQVHESAPPLAQDSGVTVKAEHVGVFHLLSMKAGESIKAGQAIGQIDTMRLLSDCKAPLSGKLTQILVEDGQPVEYGQPLFELTPEEN